VEKVPKLKFSLTGISRRTALWTLGSLLSGMTLKAVGGESRQPTQESPLDSTKILGPPVSEYGIRSSFESGVVRWRYKTPTNESSWTMTPLHDQRGVITPSSLQYERHHAGVPNIDPSRHNLYLIGLVERRLKFTVADLMRFPGVTRVCFTECSGNTLTEWVKPTLADVQQTHGLVCGTEWTGVLLSNLLKEAGVQPKAKWIIAEGADAARMNRSIPIEKAVEDAIVAYGQNGEALRPEAGYPIRLVLPGWEGSTNVKWLRILKLTERPYYTREETAKYTDLMGDGTARQFTFVMEAKSVITYPSAQHPIHAAGFVEIRGLAWSGRGKIKRVDVSTDGGKTWALAELQPPVLSKSLTQFRFPWNWNRHETIIQSRCTDETGYAQPTRDALVKVRGLNGPFGSFYHYNAIQSWKVANDGSIHNVHA
jgi:sulfane dehydrogenase subunit SoxC